MTSLITSLNVEALAITPKTTWIFVTIVSDSGIMGFGETTLNGREGEVIAALKSMSTDRERLNITSPRSVFARLSFENIAKAAISSALMQAVWDCHARTNHKSMSLALFHCRHRDKISVYANINRRTADRSPKGFAKSALEALRKGHTALKIAPFDELATDQSFPAARKAFESGIARIAAVQAIMETETRLMVDCHWRMPINLASSFVRELAGMGLYWIECPIVETTDTLPMLKLLRSTANLFGSRLAGCENEILCKGFQPYLEAGAYDVLMPDIQYCGGPSEMLRIAQMLDDRGVEFSPHNPAGPIAHAASLQVCAVVPNIDMLETQYDETPLFYELVGGPFDGIQDGIAQIPSAPGLAVTITRKVADRLPAQVLWSMSYPD